MKYDSPLLYVKKGRRYEPVGRAIFDTVDIDKKTVVIKHDRSTIVETFELDIDDEVIKHYAALRYFSSLFTDILLKKTKPVLDTDDKWRSENNKDLTPEQVEAFERLEELLPNERFTLLYDAPYKIVQDALDEFFEKIK
jgi:hypothetical protein